MFWVFGFDGGYLPYCCIVLVVVAMSISFVKYCAFQHKNQQVLPIFVNV
jgi:hypothetical protein